MIILSTNPIKAARMFDVSERHAVASSADNSGTDTHPFFTHGYLEPKQRANICWERGVFWRQPTANEIQMFGCRGITSSDGDALGQPEFLLYFRIWNKQRKLPLSWRVFQNFVTPLSHLPWALGFCLSPAHKHYVSTTLQLTPQTC